MMTIHKAKGLLAFVLVVLAMLAGVGTAEASFPGQNGKIAFDQRFRIWVKNPSLESTETKLREDGWSDGAAAFSPDGSRVAFVRRVSGPEIFVTNADGSGTPKRLTDNALVESRPTWSPDGSRIAFERGGQIWVMNADGTNQTQLTVDLATDAAKFDPNQPSSMPAWSVPMTGAPDGKIAFVHQGFIWTMLADGNGKDELDYTCPTSNGGICDNAVGNPTFSPDGSKIAAEYFGDIFIVSSSGGTSNVLLPGPNNKYPGAELDPAWSPDGTKIAFEHLPTDGNHYHIYMANANGSSTQATQLTNSVFDEFDPDWQPSSPTCDISGDANNNTLTGTAADETICGLGGNDTLKGIGGDDILLGGSGNDKLSGGLDNDIVNGGPGADTANYSASVTRVIASLTTEFATGEGTDTFSGVERLSGSGLADTLTGSGGANILNGLGGNDTLRAKDGIGGNDTIDGGAGSNDTCQRDTGDTARNCP